ncbi:MAG TPA: hypothetical protein VGQ83_33890 [Polyangia bacterium]
MKKVLWTGLVTALTAASAAVALVAARRLWVALAKEPPPEIPGWARLFVGKPLKLGFSRVLPAGASA